MGYKTVYGFPLSAYVYMSDTHENMLKSFSKYDSVMWT